MEDLQNRLSYRLHIAFCGILYYNDKKGSDAMKTEKKVTFADIAAFTGFSKTTVSRYFNDPDSLTEENQAKIADALEKLNYKENKLAKVLANGKTEIVGVIIPNLYLHYYSDILGRLIGTYEKFGYKFIVFSGNDDPEAEKNYITELLSYNIEGLIVLSHTIPSEQLCKLDIPLVTIEREDRHVFSVNTDNYMGGVQAASLLVKSGCDIVIHFNSEITEDVPAYGRIKGFKEFCESNGIDHRVVLKDAGNTFEENSAVIQSFFDDFEKEFPDKKIGVFMSNDTHANILLNIIFRKYGKLPSRFCIIGFDDSPVSREAIIPLSTIGQQVDVMASSAMELLLMQINERRKSAPERLVPEHRIITPVLVKRETAYPDRANNK